MEAPASVYEELVSNVRSRKRSKKMESFEHSFVASEAVTFLVEQGHANNRQEAVDIMKSLQDDGKIQHVTLDEEFSDGKSLFKFFTIQPAMGSNGNDVWKVDEQEVVVLNETKDEPGSEHEQHVSPMDEHNVALLNNVHPRSWQNPEDRHFPLLVIGAGAGGLISAIQGAGLGIKTAIIEQNLLGGDCLNVGCVPSKALLRCAKTIKEIRCASDFGVTITGDVKVDFGFIMQRMRKLRSEISPADSADRYSKLGASVFQGRARFVAKNAVEVYKPAEKEDQPIRLTFSKAIIATGGRAFIPPIPGLKETKYLTNATLFNLTELPEAFGIIGSGPIGVEMAQSFALFGSKVYLFDVQDKILSREDREAAEIVKKSLQECGVIFFLSSEITKVEDSSGRIKVSFKFQENDETLELDQLLVSTGRTPNVEGLGLDVAKVQCHQRGIKVADGLKTTNSNIYAVGDVCLKTQFTHMADASAKVAFRNAMFPFTSEKMSKLVVPWCTYTSPEIAHVGAYEGELDEKKKKYRVFKSELSHNDRAILEGGDAPKGFVKLIVKEKSDKILGCTIVAEEAGDMISEVTACMVNKVGAQALSGVIHPYPTTADAIRICAGQVNKSRLTPGTKRLLRRLIGLKTWFS